MVISKLTSAVVQTPGTINSIKTGKSYINLDENLKADNSDINIQNKANNNLQQSTNNISQSLESNGLNELNTINDNQKYQYIPTSNEKSNNLKQSASKYLNNSQETIDLVNTIDKVIQDKGYNVIFDDTITNLNGQSVNAQIKTLNNGEIEIKINPNSPRAGEFLLCHEITHAIETDSMKQLILDYASKNSEFNQALESLKQTYGTNDVSSEVIADISGQLFGYQEFINNLSMKQPNIFKRIYNKIIELANKITGNSKESLFIKDLKNKWEAAYRNTTTEQSVKNLNDSTKYMMTSVKGMQNGINTSNRYQDIKNRYDRALQLETSG